MVFGGKTKDKEIKALLSQLAGEPIVKCADLLDQFFSDGANRETLLRGIIEYEHTGDRLVAKTYGLIDQSFITWIDKRDLTSLLDAFDQILDRMREAAQQAVVYRVSDLTEAKELTAIIKNMVVKLKPMAQELDKPKIEPLIEPAGELHDLEHRADEIRYAGLERLYPVGHSGVVLCADRILWILETVTDNCDLAAKVMISIARKAG